MQVLTNNLTNLGYLQLGCAATVAGCSIRIKARMKPSLTNTRPATSASRQSQVATPVSRQLSHDMQSGTLRPPRSATPSPIRASDPLAHPGAPLDASSILQT